jgi:hypothetical protein
MMAGPAAPIRPTSRQVIPMNRTALLISGAICWAVAAADAAVHLAGGDVVVPIGMGLVFAAWLGLRATQVRRQAVVAA